MPKRDKEKYNVYMKKYMLKRYHERRQAAIVFLGGSCVVCKSEDNLNFHHLENKEFSVSKLWSLSKTRFWAEIAKCELRCEKHHKEEHKIKNEHGTARKYWQGCRCSSCVDAFHKYTNEYRYRAGRRKRK